MSTFKTLLVLFFIALSAAAFAQRPKDPETIRRNKQLMADSVNAIKEAPKAATKKTQEPVEEEEEEFVKPKDTTNYPLLTEIHLMADYGKLLMLATPIESKAEGGVQVLFENRILASFSYGYGSINPTNAYKNANYNATGTWAKPGLFYQFSINPNSKIQIGAQYGLARYRDSGTITIESGSGLFEPYQQPWSREQRTGNWWELSVQSEGKFRGNFWLGFRASMRNLIGYDDMGSPDVLVVPGYGKTVNNMVGAINFYIKYKINFFTPPPPPVEAP